MNKKITDLTVSSVTAPPGCSERNSNEVLAVVVPHYGQATETFIRRYCEDLLPRQTVLIYFYEGHRAWQVAGPVLSLPKDGFGSTTLWKAFRGVQKVCGVNGLFGDPYTFNLLARFLRKHGVTAVFSQYLIAGWNVHPVVKRLGIRHVVRGHGFDVSSCLDQKIWRERFLALDDADAIVVPSPFQVQRLREVGLNSGNIFDVPYGVDFPVLQPKSVRENEADSRLIQILAAGRMVAKKAPLALVQSFLAAAKQVPELRLTYIGGGELENSVHAYVEEHDLTGKIKLVGTKSHSEVLGAMASADVFLQHSVTDPVTGDQEGAPVAILEAMACGLPVVSTVHSGIPYLVENGESGLLTPEGDVEAMAESLVMIAGSTDLRETMGRKGRERAEALNWERERETLLRLLFPVSD